jgi:hypothetical protein
MSGGSVKLTRRELYKQVWSEPMTKLAERYGLSDVGLAKICKKNKISRPTRGYWARKQAGNPPKRTPLPPGDSDKIIEIHPNPHSMSNPAVENVIEKEISSIKEKESPIVVPKTLRNPHPLVEQSAAILEIQKPNNHGLLEPTKKRCLDIQVSKTSLRRALRIMDALIKALETRGYQVCLSEGATKVKVLEFALHFGISEQLVTERLEPKDHDLEGSYRFGHSRFREQRVPSGVLCLTIHKADGHWLWDCRKNWRDGKKQQLENSLNNFISGLLRAAAQIKERVREEQERERERRERLRRLEEERRIRAEKRRRIQEEQERVSSLISQADDWHKSKLIREYIAAVEKMSLSGDCPVQPEGNLNEWVKWAREQADRLDPLTPNPPSILDEDFEDDEGKNKHRDEYGLFRHY